MWISDMSSPGYLQILITEKAEAFTEACEFTSVRNRVTRKGPSSGAQRRGALVSGAPSRAVT